MIYLHIPFCKSRCIYCDFYSTTQSSNEWRKRFVQSLCNELVVRKNYLPSNRVSTIYFGGGTPSQLLPTEIEQILDCIYLNYQVDDDAELTFEANPDDITPNYVQALLGMGINRVSLGVQSFDEQLLKLLHRRHTAVQAQESVCLLAQKGLSNISIDLMYGLPFQTLAQFKLDLEIAFSLPIKHLSSYALSIEEGTVLSRKIAAGDFRVADENLYAEEYDLLLDISEQAGFEHYEISNFALPGYQSRHNSAYWNQVPYLGCGPGAHSFDGTNRRFNLSDLKSYISENLDDPPHEIELLTKDEHFNELVFTSLRTKRGLNLDYVKDKFGKDFFNQMIQEASKHIQSNKLEIIDGYMRVTRGGIFVSDDIMSDLMR